MNLDSIPLFSMLRSRLGYDSQRERLIAQNVANADTPGYAPRDLSGFNVTQAMGPAQGSPGLVEPVRTSPSHLTAPNAATAGDPRWKTVTTPDSETTLDGNRVVLEDQMTKMTETRMDYEAAVGFYQKALEMIRTAARSPGK